jgi:hypothetical protein
MLESASLLGLSFLCTYGTPVADILAHLHRLPLILDYCDPHDYITADDELGIILALENRDRVRRIRIMQPVQTLQRLIKALDGEFPNLEYLFIERHTFYIPGAENTNNAIVDIPETFRAPRLRYLMVMGFPISIGAPSFTTMGNVVVLSLSFDIHWAYFHPNPLLQLMPQLETSGNTLNAYISSDDMESQLLRRAVMRRVTPYLHRFGLQGSNAYLEALLPRVTIRLLERLQLHFFDRLKTYLILPRRQLMSSAETVGLRTVRVTFLEDCLLVNAYSHYSNFKTYRFCMSQGGSHLDRQLASVTKFFHTFTEVFSPVETLLLRHNGLPLTPSESERNNEADRTQWHELFRAFGKLKSLFMDHGLVGHLSRVLQPDEHELQGESPTTDLLLPELRELGYSVILEHSQLDDRNRNHTFFAEFASARRNAGRPVQVIEAAIPLALTRL